MYQAISIVCQEGGHKTALEYARLLKGLSIPLHANFPNGDGIPIAEDATQLINDRTAALVVILSSDIFPGGKRNPKFRIDTEVIRYLLERSKTGQTSRIFIVLNDADVEPLVEKSWIANIQYFTDNAFTREQILSQLSKLEPREESEDSPVSIDDVQSIIHAIEPGCTISEIASYKFAKEKISYQVFECLHKLRKRKINYVYLHRGVTLVNTAKHLNDNFSEIFLDRSKFVLLPMEHRAVRPLERLENVKLAFSCDEAEYLEDVVFKLIVDTIDVGAISDTAAVARDFIEPQVRFNRTYGPSNEQAFSKIYEWLCNDSAGILVLSGQGGIGKTWAMLNLRQRVTQGDLRFRKAMERRVLFITSTDIIRGIGTSFLKTKELTIYDLYVASCVALHGADSQEWLDRNTFYNALELGNILVFIDGLDEVISRNRSRFNSNNFFSDINNRFSNASDAKIVISCRNIFFDDDQYGIEYPHVSIVDLLAFDAGKRDQFFREAFSRFPNMLRKALHMSERLAKLPDGRYVPFVLSLIRDGVTQDADNSSDQLPAFTSDFLNVRNQFDRVVGQFCHRETYKVVDPLVSLSVDLQVRVFCEIARIQEGEQGSVTRKVLTGILEQVLNKQNVEAITSHLETHPFISQENLRRNQLFTFRFDFMPEYFAMVHVSKQLAHEYTLNKSELRLLNRFGTAGSLFTTGIVSRFVGDESEFMLKIIDLLNHGWAIIKEYLPQHENDFFNLESFIAQFTHACVGLLCAFITRSESASTDQIDKGLKELFFTNGALRNVVILDGLVGDEYKIRLNFKGLRVENCTFNSMDFWSCQFDSQTRFVDCKISGCTGAIPKDSTIRLASFQNCQFDDDFESAMADLNRRIDNTAEKALDAIRSFISDFHRQGGFRKIKLSNLERYYGQSNSAVPFRRIYQLMRKHGVVVEIDMGRFTEVAIAPKAAVAAERLITQAVLDTPLSWVANDIFARS
jgi:hypothetical protein